MKIEMKVFVHYIEDNLFRIVLIDSNKGNNKISIIIEFDFYAFKDMFTLTEN